jgi:four helix bundle protein
MSEFSAPEFHHEKLVVYQKAKEFLRMTTPLLQEIPRGSSHVKDQLRRASESLLLNVGEGAGRFAPKEKARFYEIASGSGTECAAALDVMEIRDLGDTAIVIEARSLLSEVVRMLSAMSRTARERAG